MNILIDILPTEIVINNKVYEVNSDFRTLILINLLLCDVEADEDFKTNQILILFYNLIPDNVEDAIRQLAWFNRCGKEIEYKKSKKSNSTSNKRILDYEKDADFIYSAFRSQYKINLQKEDDLHWWEFQSLLNGLNENNKICEIMKYRGMDLSKIQDKEQKKFYKEMQEIYSLDDGFTFEEIEELEEEKNKWK